MPHYRKPKIAPRKYKKNKSNNMQATPRRLSLFLSSIIGFLMIILLVLLPTDNFVPLSYAPHTLPQAAIGGPIISNNTQLKVELVSKGLKAPTSMAFLGPNDVLVLEKKGNVQRIINGKISLQPLLHVNVATQVERGLLGIAIAKHTHGPTYVFLYYTESSGGGSTTGAQALGNRLYRYELVNDNQLTNPKLLLDLPAIPANPLSAETDHNGGKVIIGPDGNVYTVIGDVGSHRGQMQNVVNGPPPDRTGGVLRVTQNGQVTPNSPLGTSEPLNTYYAYGIRNSFGMDFDPVTGNLWDTENGPSFGDEINLVNPGFNSGWVQVQGIWKAGASPGPVIGADNNNPPKNLVTFAGAGKYRSPALTWNQPVAPTALKFLNSTSLGKQYENDMFVGDILNGNLYHFKLNQHRDGLVLTGSVATGNNVVNTPQENQQFVFAHGFGGITDLQVGPDGYLYVLSYTDGAIYRIVPSSSSP
jgi:aldose sugar dehydrogenase